MNIQIKHRYTGAVLYEGEHATMKEAVLAAIKSGADLRSADLRSANLRSANLSYANLRSANLSYANFSEGSAYAQISFAGHGECGRMLTAVKIGEEVTLYCGCFKVSEAQLKEYINAGLESLKESRFFAMNAVLEALKFKTNK